MKIAIYYTLLISISLFIACNENAENNQIDNLNETDINSLNKSDEIKKGFYLGMPITYQVIDGEYILDGDIILRKKDVYNSLSDVILKPGQKKTKTEANRSAITRGLKWPNNTVYYSINPDLPNKYRVVDAISHWESKTNLKFVKRSNQTGYIYFTPGQGCRSLLGYIGDKQKIVLGQCDVGRVIHEIGHSIGLFHEMSRSDRDSYINVIEEYIYPFEISNFKKYLDIFSYKGSDHGAFDFNSVMMYGPKYSSKNGLPTITKKDGSTYENQIKALSSGDIAGIKKLYPSSGDTNGTIYKNNRHYTLHGLRVYRYKDQWWFNDGNKWKIVELKGTSWHDV